METKPNPHSVVKGILDPKAASEALVANGCLPPGFFEDPLRLFQPSKSYSERGVNSPIPYPGRVSQAVGIAYALEEFLMAEQLVREIGVALAGINKWWIDQAVRAGQKDVYAANGYYPTVPAQVIIWQDKFYFANSRHRFDAVNSWTGWELVSTTLTACGLPYFERDMPTKSAIWEGDEEVISKFWTGEGGIYLTCCKNIASWPSKALENYLAGDSSGKKLTDFKNPIRPLLDLMQRTHHGMVESALVRGRVPALSVGFNLL